MVIAAVASELSDHDTTFRKNRKTSIGPTVNQRQRFHWCSLRSHHNSCCSTTTTTGSTIGVGILLLLLWKLNSTLLVVAFTVLSTRTVEQNTAWQDHQRPYHFDPHHHHRRHPHQLLGLLNDSNNHASEVVVAAADIVSSVAMASISMKQNQDRQNDFGTVSTTTTTTPTSDVNTDNLIANEASVVNDHEYHDKPKETAKIVVYGIRHGRSMSNEWMCGENEWGTATYNDRNNIRDSPLSEHGILQAQQLCEQLRNELNMTTTTHGTDDISDHWLCNVDMILVSPLTRCLQTYKYAIAPLKLEQSPRPYVHPLLTERLYSLSEMGRSLLELQTEFPDMDWTYFGDDMIDNSIWWYDPAVATPYNTMCNTTGSDSDHNDDNGRGLLEEYKEWRPYGDGQFYMCPGEPEMVFQRRMEALRLWIYKAVLAKLRVSDQVGDVPKPNSSPSNNYVEPRTVNVLTIGHWGVYKYFTNGSELENCQICTWEL